VVFTMSFTITMRGIIVSALWVAGVVAAVLDALYAPRLAAVTMVCVSIAATLSVRGSIDRYAANWEAAYDAGREVTRIRQRR
jgi:hypothetical protein